MFPLPLVGERVRVRGMRSLRRKLNLNPHPGPLPERERGNSMIYLMRPDWSYENR